MMITMNRVGNSITGTVNGKSYGVTFSKERWDAMEEVMLRANSASSMDELKRIIAEFEPLTQESYKELAETSSPFLFINPATNRFYLKWNNMVSKEPLPKAFVDRILESIEKDIDPKPLIKCWARFLRNPNYTAAKAELFAWYISQTYTNPKRKADLIKDGVSEEKAHELATTFQTPITVEGLLCTYKVSREITKKYALGEDGESVVEKSRYEAEVDEFTGLKSYKMPESVEDRYFEPAVQGKHGDGFSCTSMDKTPLHDNSKGQNHVIRVGAVHALPKWEMVNCNDYISCVPGLHCGNLDYIRAYQSEGTVTHDVLVDPMHIGAIVQDNTGALRVKEYMVHRSMAGVNRSIYHSATYAALKDEEYAALVEEVVKKTAQEKIDAANEALEQAEGLSASI